MPASPTARLVRIFAFAVLASLTAAAETNETAAVDEQKVDRSDPNFVTASLLIFGPGEELFSCAGHACIRLECPTYKLDYCFSYESEPIKEKVATFFAGRLKMGMFAIPSAQFFSDYEGSGRGCWQYKLNLTPVVKQRLWKILDDKVAEGANLSYDYVRRGCAWSVLGCLRAALDPVSFEISDWPAKYDLTRREITSSELPDHPWKVFALHAIWGFETDAEVTRIEKVLMPNDLVEFLKRAKVRGVSVIQDEGVEILPQKHVSPAPFLTPMFATCLLLLIAVGNFFFRRSFVDWMFLSLQSVAGLFFAYLVCFSSLPATSWNWLIVPFNPLPLVFWRWRRWWALPFAAVLVAWEVFMLLSPHQLTDSAYLVLVLAYIVFYAKMTVEMFRPTSG